MTIIKKRLDVFLRYKPLLGQLIAKDIKLKYRRSVLGYFWSIQIGRASCRERV